MRIKEYLTQNKFFFLFIVLITYFIISSFLETRLTQYVFGLLFSAVMLLSLLVVTDAKRPLMFGAVLLAISSFIVMSTGVVYSYEPIHIVHMVLIQIFLILITSVSLYSTYTFGSVTLQTLYGAVCTYLLMGLTWTEAYLIMFHIDHNAFSLTEKTLAAPILHHTFTYFSFVTLSTLGYGDILPVSAPARTFAWLEAIMGQAYITILIAQLVGQYIVQKKDAS